MFKLSLFAAAFMLATSATAHAGGQPGTIGVGAEFQLSGLGGVSVNYDAGQFHLGGFLGYQDPQGPGNEFEIGGRFFYHVHSTAMSDFGIGGGIGIASASPGFLGNMSANRDTLVVLEPGFQIRLFLAPNVALSFTGGFAIGVADADGVAIGAVPEGGAGVHYYF